MTSSAFGMNEMKDVAQRLAGELANIAERPIVIVFGDETVENTAFAGDAIRINVDLSVVNSVRLQSQAAKVFPALVYSGFATQCEPAWEQYVEAQQGGFEHLFHVINDEHTLRGIIAKQPAWGADLQVLARHYFPQRPTKVAAIDATSFGGRMLAVPAEGSVAATAAYADRLAKFSYAFRRQLAAANALVASAVALVPENLKDLSKDGVLALAREIHTKLAEGITVQAPVVEAVAEIAAPAPAPQVVPEVAVETVEVVRPTPQPEATVVVTPPVAAEATPWYKKGWYQIGAALFTAFWVGLFMKSGMNFWLFVALMATVVLGGGFIVVTAYRSNIGEFFSRIGDSIGNGWDAFRESMGVAIDHTCSFFQHEATRKVLKYSAIAIGVGCGALLASVLPLWSILLILPVAAIGACIAYTGQQTAIREGHQHENGGGNAEGREIDQKHMQSLTLLMTALFGVAVVYMLGSFGFDWIVRIIGGLVLTSIVMVISAILFFRASTTWDQRRNRGQVKEGLKLMFGGVGLVIAGAFGATLAIVGGFFAGIWACIKACGWLVATVAGAIGTAIATICKEFVREIRRLGWRFEPAILNLWSMLWVRLAVMCAIPGALIVTTAVLGWTVLENGGKSWPAFVGMVCVVIAITVLAIVARKQIVRLIINEAVQPWLATVGSSAVVGLDLETATFVRIDEVREVQVDREVVVRLATEVVEVGAALRPFLERLGENTTARHDQVVGDDIGDTPELVLQGDLAIRDDEQVTPLSSVFIGAAGDCSTSQLLATAELAPGKKFERTQTFMLALDQAMAGLARVSGKFWGFNDSIIYDAGEPGEHKSSGLKCRGGNNDTAMLAHMRSAALSSGKDLMVLVLIGDLQPADASWRSLRDEIAQCERDGIIVIMLTTENTNRAALDNAERVISLCGQTLEQAAMQLGQVLDGLVVRA